MSTYSISALMPVKNGEIYLPESIKSINENSSALSEIIVINDGSTDNSSTILNEWAKINPKVSLIETSGVGLVAALNLGLSTTRSDYVARFDVDDQYAGHRIQSQIALLNETTVAIFSDYEIFSSSRSNLGTILSPIFGSETSVSLIKQQRTPHPSVLFSRNAVEAVGGYRSEDFPAEDLSLWLRLSRVGQLRTVPEKLLRYRLSNSSVTFSNQLHMNAKRLELLNSIRVNKPDVLLSLEQLNSGRSSYQNELGGAIRQLLHIRELRMACAQLGIESSKFVFEKNVFHELTSLRELKEVGAFVFKGLDRKISKHFQG
jgi:glycosyltransferase involved in cell wall biosynthesis